LAKRDQHELSPDAVSRITRVVQSLCDDRIERGVDLDRPMHCDSCGQEKNPEGSAVYGAYKLCNECLLEFTLALAGNQVQNVADFMTRRSEGPLPDLANHRERQSLPLGQLQGRDKLMPSNEPC
jgi:hypothetical protein